MDTQVMITTEGLTKKYGHDTAVDHLTFQVNAGEIFGFLGPNGAGKTTTILMLLGLTQPTSGQARVADVDPTRNPITVKRMAGYLQENMGFYRDLTGPQMLRYIADLNQIPRTEQADRIKQALINVGLWNDAHKPIGTYSRGMRQRLGIAEILIKAPKVAFLDEPTLGLDPDGTNRMMDLILRLCKEQKMTMLLSSHFLYQVQQVCDRVGIMIKGKMVAQGPMAKLAQEKLGIGTEEFSLEEVYMKYFQEA